MENVIFFRSSRYFLVCLSDVNLTMDLGVDSSRLDETILKFCTIQSDEKKIAHSHILHDVKE